MHFVIGCILLLLLVYYFNLLLEWAQHKASTSQGSEHNDLVEAIHELLPHTQCAQCGEPGCKPYAKAVAAGGDHRLCPPGGQALQHQLADLLNRPRIIKPLVTPPQQVAIIREEECIGCIKCLEACPVDAIVGASQFMHTVISSECTGCELCIAPCPVDCIDLVEISS